MPHRRTLLRNVLLVVVLAGAAVAPRLVRALCCENGLECTTAFTPAMCDGTYYATLLCLVPNTPGSVCVGQGATCTSSATCNDGIPSTCDFCAPNIASPFGAFVCTHAAGCDDGNPCTDDICSSAGGAFACTHVPNHASCDDGNACTTGDHCVASSCTGAFPAACDDHDPCTSDTCSGSAGGSFVCHHAPSRGAPCDDGDRCTVNDRCTANGCAGDPSLTTCHYECYETKRSAFAGPTVTLDDAFGSSSALVQRPERLCAPADKNGEDPTAPSSPDHLVGYRIRHAFTPRLRQHVVDQFGARFLDVVKVDRLMVPTAKSLIGAGPPLAAPAIDHFQCYTVHRSRQSPKFAPVSGVTVTDQFGPVTVTVKKPIRLCAPVDKNGEDPGAPADKTHLLCYKTTRAPSPIVSPSINNQFGRQAVALLRRTELCVPAVLTSPGCDDGIPTSDEDCDPPGSLTCPGSAIGAFVACNPDCTCPASPSGAFVETTD